MLASLCCAGSAWGPAVRAMGRMAVRDVGAGIAGTQAPSLLLWQWELEMQKAAHPLEEAGTGSTQQHSTHLQVCGPIPATPALGGRRSFPQHPGHATKRSLG